MNEKLIDTLGANGIKTLVLDGKSYDDVKREIGILAALTGRAEKGGGARPEDGQRPRRRAPLHPAGEKARRHHPQHGAGTLRPARRQHRGLHREQLGWENTAAGMPALDKNPDAAPYSMETLVAQNPDILFVTSMGDEAEIRASMEAMVCG